jgi:hypothetical protein
MRIGSGQHYWILCGTALAAVTFFSPLAQAQQSWNPTKSDTQYNTAAGDGALGQLAGFHNTSIGYYSLHSNTRGSYNTAMGDGALEFNTAGNNNTACGYETLYSNTTGRSNAALGFQALFYNTNGINNVAVGSAALDQLTSGNNNIALGFKAGQWTKTGSANIYIGNFGAASGSETSVIRIGQAQKSVFIAGIRSVPLSGATVVVNSAGQLVVIASSARYKTNIEPLGDASDKLAQLRPVSYEYKTEPGTTHYGLVAEEVDKVIPEIVVRDEQGRPESVQYQELIPLLLQQVKLQRALIEQQAKAAERQAAIIERLQAKVDRQSRSDMAAIAKP